MHYTGRVPTVLAVKIFSIDPFPNFQLEEHQDQPGKAATAALVGADSPKEVLFGCFPNNSFFQLGDHHERADGEPSPVDAGLLQAGGDAEKDPDRRSRLSL